MKKLLFTGAHGFLGNNILPLLEQAYEVDTLGLSQEDDYPVNLAQEVPVLPTPYDMVLHAAGEVYPDPRTDAEKQRFYEVNYQGTVNLCKALERGGGTQALVFISTVAVYGCDDGKLIAEDHLLEGKTPYGESKIMAEKYLTQWCLQHGVVLGILRPSLIVGQHARGSLGAMVRGVRKGFYVNIGGGNARKSMLMAADIVRLLPALAQKGGVYNVCDSCHPSFAQLSASVARQLGKRRPLSIPYWMAWCLARLGDMAGRRAPINSYRLMKMTHSLTFSNEKARRELGWEPLDVLTNYQLQDE